MAREMSGKLLICGTPIGNLRDISDRLREALGEADVVYAEDTRRSRILLDAVGARPPTRSFFAGNEAKRSKQLEEELAGGKTVALVTDAGMPGVGDPGHTAVIAAKRAGATISVIPGPSAVTAAVAVAGMGDRFVFESFLPRKGSSRQARLSALIDEPRPAVIFCSPKRLIADLEDLAEHLGRRRPVCVTRELTKLHEEIWWGDLGGALDHWSQNNPRGEITIVVGGATVKEIDWEEAEAAVQTEIQSGTRPAEAIRGVAGVLGVPKNELYRRVMKN